MNILHRIISALCFLTCLCFFTYVIAVFLGSYLLSGNEISDTSSDYSLIPTVEYELLLTNSKINKTQIMDMHEKESQFIDDLEKHYSLESLFPLYKLKEIRDILTIQAKTNVDVRENVQCTLNVTYAEGPAAKIDIFADKILPEDAPIFIFVHGGYWIWGSRQFYSYIVPPFVEAGVVCAVVSYDLVNDKVLIPDIVVQIQEAINYVLDYAINRKSRGVYVCGHSAGAHLIMMALSSIPKNEKYSSIKGVIPISGLYDLNPLLKTSVAKTVKLSEEIAKKCSPITVVSELKNNLGPSTKIFVAVGELENPAFKDQSESYHTALKSSSLDSEFLLLNGEDHSTIVGVRKELGELALTEKILELIKRNESGSR